VQRTTCFPSAATDQKEARVHPNGLNWAGSLFPTKNESLKFSRGWVYGTECIGTGGKAAAAWSWPLTNPEVMNAWLFTSTRHIQNGVVLDGETCQKIEIITWWRSSQL